MLNINGHTITYIEVGGHEIMNVYFGASLVWQNIRSCYGSGVWRPEKPWLGKDTWKNNK